VLLIRWWIATSTVFFEGIFLWPRKCHGIGVNVTANFEMPTPVQAPASSITTPDTTDRSTQTFGQTLLEASKESSPTPIASNVVTVPTSRQNSNSNDGQAHRFSQGDHASAAPASTHHVVGQKQIAPTHLAPVADPMFVAIPVPISPAILSQDDSTAAAQQSRYFSAQEDIASSNSPSNSTQAAGLLANQFQPGIGSSGNLAHASNQDRQGTSTAILPQQVPTLDESMTEARAAWMNPQAPGQNAISGETASSPRSSTSILGENLTSEDLSSVSSAPTSSSALNAAPIPEQSFPSQMPPATKPAPATIPRETENIIPAGAQNSLQVEMAKAVASALPIAEPVQVSDSAPNASVKGNAASASTAVSTGKTTAPQAVAAQSASVTSLGTSSSISDQLVAIVQPGGGFSAEIQPVAASANSTTAVKTPSTSVAEASKDASSDATNLKQHFQAVSDAASQTASHNATSPVDQRQTGASSQGTLDTAPATLSFAGHSVDVAVQVQSTPVAATVQNASASAVVNAHAAKAQDATATVSTPAPQPLPTINSAKLVQSMGQSEMRVGMRSIEFGNISISTSSSQNSISAQISLDHSELAKTLAAHLPEMQARLGANQPMNVRIDLNGTNTTGQGAGTFGGASHGSANQSQSGRQQPGSAAPDYSGSASVLQFSPVAAAMASSDGSLNSHLDITV